jgi:hypothetical protein
MAFSCAGIRAAAAGFPRQLQDLSKNENAPIRNFEFISGQISSKVSAYQR